MGGLKVDDFRLYQFISEWCHGFDEATDDPGLKKNRPGPDNPALTVKYWHVNPVFEFLDRTLFFDIYGVSLIDDTTYISHDDYYLFRGIKRAVVQRAIEEYVPKVIEIGRAELMEMQAIGWGINDFAGKGLLDNEMYGVSEERFEELKANAISVDDCCSIFTPDEIFRFYELKRKVLFSYYAPVFDVHYQIMHAARELERFRNNLDDGNCDKAIALIDRIHSICHTTGARFADDLFKSIPQIDKYQESKGGGERLAGMALHYAREAYFWATMEDPLDIVANGRAGAFIDLMSPEAAGVVRKYLTITGRSKELVSPSVDEALSKRIWTRNALMKLKLDDERINFIIESGSSALKHLYILYSNKLSDKSIALAIKKKIYPDILVERQEFSAENIRLYLDTYAIRIKELELPQFFRHYPEDKEGYVRHALFLYLTQDITSHNNFSAAHIDRVLKSEAPEPVKENFKSYAESNRKRLAS